MFQLVTPVTLRSKLVNPGFVGIEKIDRLIRAMVEINVVYVEDYVEDIVTHDDVVTIYVTI